MVAWTAAAATALAALPAVQAFFILSHPVLETTRLDPIVAPGKVAQHLHSIVGGSAFAKDFTYDSMIKAKCTTAPVSIDKSNYWAPQLFYYDKNDQTYQAIPVDFVQTYYLPRGGGGETEIKAPPKGLRMIAGNPNRRTFNDSNAADHAVSYVCLDYNGNHAGDPEWVERKDFFKHNCPNGMRAQVNFPTCWDGVNLDSPNHKSHMAYPIGKPADAKNGAGKCPPTHPVKIVQVFYEWVFAVNKFPYNGPGTWVFANGDNTGLGFHADYVQGWDEPNGVNVLQQAINECDPPGGIFGELEKCPPFLPYLNHPGDRGACTPEFDMVHEEVGFGSKLTRLPGNNPLWVGEGPKPSWPGYVETDKYYSPVTPLPAGWTYTGCVAEPQGGRALTAKQTKAPGSMTRNQCIAFCAAAGFKIAGVEYGQECYCDNAFQSGASAAGNSLKCTMRCDGNNNENCGGPGALDVFAFGGAGTPSAIPSMATTTPVKPTRTAVPTTTTSSAAPPPTASSTAPGIPSGWSYTGCIAEGTTGRALQGAQTSSNDMTRARCVAFCAGRGFSIAGVEYGRECYCDHDYRQGASLQATSAKCTMKCAGSDDTCGGPAALDVYTNPALAPAPVQLPNGWTANGCYSEPSAGRALTGYTLTSPKMTYDLCINACQGRGFAYAGLEFGSECYCGNTFATGAAKVGDGECGMACSGDNSRVCGGGRRLTTFAFTK